MPAVHYLGLSAPFNHPLKQPFVLEVGSRDLYPYYLVVSATVPAYKPPHFGRMV